MSQRATRCAIVSGVVVIVFVMLSVLLVQLFPNSTSRMPEAGVVRPQDSSISGTQCYKSVPNMIRLSDPRDEAALIRSQARNVMHGPPISRTENPFCRNHDGSAVRVLCPSSPRLSVKQQLAFIDAVERSEVFGWMQPVHGLAALVLTSVQHDASVYGTVGAIGIQEGFRLYFTTLARTSSETEPLFALNLFDSPQEINFGSGGETRDFFGENVKKWSGLSENGMKNSSLYRVLNTVSAEVTAATVFDGLPLIRLFSISGRRSTVTTMHNMALATCHLADGGIIVVNDYSNKGVRQGIQNVMELHPKNIVPLAVFNNKYYFTTPSHFKRYWKALESEPLLHLTLYHMFGCPVGVWFAENDPDSFIFARWRDLVTEQEQE